MSIRHDKCDLLERLLKENGGGGLAIHVEHKVTGLPAGDFYHSLDALMMQKKKIQPSAIKLHCGQAMPIYITSLPEDKSRRCSFSDRYTRLSVLLCSGSPRSFTRSQELSFEAQ